MPVQILGARSPTVDASNRYRTGTSLPNANCSRAITRVAISESPPRAKKIVIEPDPIHAQHLGEHPGDDLFGLGLRRPEGCGGKHRCRQRLTVDLARGGQRELVEHHNVRRHHVLGQPRAQPLTHRADLGVGVGVVGVGAALVGPGGGQVEVGQRCGVLAAGSVGVMKTASRVPGWAPQVTATWYPVVSPRRCNSSGTAASAVAAVAWASASARGSPAARAVFDADVADQSGAGDLGDADGGGTLGYQPGRAARSGPRIGSTPRWVRRPVSAPAWGSCGW